MAILAMDSARDLIQYMERRGQITQEEAARLYAAVREVLARAIELQGSSAQHHLGAAGRLDAAEFAPDPPQRLLVERIGVEDHGRGVAAEATAGEGVYQEQTALARLGHPVGPGQRGCCIVPEPRPSSTRAHRNPLSDILLATLGWPDWA